MPGQGIGGTTGKFFPTIKLPMGVTCENCVLYWTTGITSFVIYKYSLNFV
jgi:hypothetical protein